MAFRTLVLSCLSIVEYNLLINDSISGKIYPFRGLWQGDFLSPFLFILGVEILTRLLLKEEGLGRIHGVQICKGEMPILHLLYVDDILITCWANEQEASAVKRVLQIYGEWSGQKVGQDKSNIFISSGVYSAMKRKIKAMLGFQGMKKDVVYLRNTFFFGRNRAKEFGKLKKRVQGRLESWQS